MARSRAGLIRSTITRAAVRPVPNPKGLIIALPRRLRIHAACKAAYASTNTRRFPSAGATEVKYPDGRPSRFFYWDDIPGRRLRPDLVNGAAARGEAKRLARAEQAALDSP